MSQHMPEHSNSHNGAAFGMPPVAPAAPSPFHPRNINPNVEIPTSVTVGMFPDGKVFMDWVSGQASLNIVTDPDMMIKFGQMLIQQGRQARSGLVIPNGGLSG